MQIVLTDKKMMPGSGFFHFKVLSQEEFVETVTFALNSEILNCMIQDWEITNIISEIVGQKVPTMPLTKSQEINLETGDKLLSIQVLINVNEEAKQVLDATGQPMEQSILVNVIQTTYYDETPDGIVAAAIDCQNASGDTMNDWYLKLRETFNTEVPITITEYKKDE